MWPGLAVASSGHERDLVGDVDELARVLELRGVDEVHAHQVGHVTGGDAAGDLVDHLGVRDVRQVDRLVGIAPCSSRRRAGRPCPCCRPSAPTSASRCRRRSARSRRRAPGSSRPAARRLRRRGSTLGAVGAAGWEPSVAAASTVPSRRVPPLHARPGRERNEREGRQPEMVPHRVLLHVEATWAVARPDGGPTTRGCGNIPQRNRVHTYDFMRGRSR